MTEQDLNQSSQSYPSLKMVLLVFFASAVLLTVGAVVGLLFPAFYGFVPSIWFSEWLLAVPPVFFLRARKLSARNYLSLRRFEPKLVLVGVVVAVLSYPGLTELFAIMEILLGPYPDFLLKPILAWFPRNWFELAVWIGGIAVSAGVAEEVLFRGFIQNSLRARWSPAAALAASSLLFGIIHLDPWRIPFAIVFGLVSGYLLLRTNSLYPSIVFHIGVNSISQIAGFLNVEAPEAGPTWRILMLGSTVLLLLTLIFIGKFRR